MSPEQARGEPVDLRSDQFSFGLILYEMLSGKRAFDRETPISTLSAIIEADFAPLAAVTPSIPAPVRWCVERCLSKDRELRYADTQDLHRELKVLLDRLPEMGTPMPAAPARSPRQRVRTVLTAAVLGIAIITAGLATLQLVPEGTVDLNRYRLQPVATEGVYEGEPAWSPDGKNLAYAGEVESVRQVFVKPLSSPNAAQITRSAVDCDMPFWSSDGSRIYYLSPAGNVWSLWSVPATGGSPRHVQDQVAAAAVSPDGSTLAFLRKGGAEGGVSLWYSTGGGTPLRYAKGPLSTPAYGMGHIAFSPDGRKIGAWLSHWNGRSEFWILPWPSGEPVMSLTLRQDAEAFNWMPDSRRILFGARMAGTTGSDLQIADTGSGRVLPLTKTNTEAEHPAVTPDGRRIAFTSAHNDFDLIEVPIDGSAPRSILASSRSESHPAWSPAGGQYAYVTDRTGPPQIWIKSRSEGWDRPLVTETDFGSAWVASFESVVFSRDGQRIAYTVTGSSGHAIYVTNVLGGPPLKLIASDSDHRSPSWSPDGSQIAFVLNDDGKWSLNRVGTGGGEKPVKIRSLPGPCNPQWSPSSDRIVCLTEQGLSLIEADGSCTPLSRYTWLVHGWNKDGSAIHGIIQLPNRHRALATIDVTKSAERIVAELPVAAATAVQGFSLSPEGDRFLTAFGRPRADIWILEGFERPGLWAAFKQLTSK